MDEILDNLTLKKFRMCYPFKFKVYRLFNKQFLMYKNNQAQKGEINQPYDSIKAKFFYLGAYAISKRAKQLAQNREASKSA